MARSLATFEPTRSMRWLGLFGVVGGALLLFAFLSWTPFQSIAVNTVRLIVFGMSGAAIAIAFYPRQAHASPALLGAVLVSGRSGSRAAA